MKYFKNLLKTLLYTLIFFTIFSLLLTIFNYFNIINYQTLAIGKIIVPILSLGLSGLLMGKKVEKNGWLEGLKISLIITILLIIITFILGEFSAEKLTFYLILIISGIFGSIIGINTKTT